MAKLNGKLIIICAPSGTGKTTIVKALLPRFSRLEFSVSACSRASRSGEINGKDYYFLTPDEFKERIKRGDFLEWEEVYPGSFYGTLKSEVKRIWDKGSHVIFDVDVLGGLSIKKQYPDNSLAIFIKPPSVDELKKRLVGRGTETDESLQKRIEKARLEMTYEPKFDVSVVNDDLQHAVEKTHKLVDKFLNKS